MNKLTLKNMFYVNPVNPPILVINMFNPAGCVKDLQRIPALSLMPVAYERKAWSRFYQREAPKRKAARVIALAN